MFSSNKIVGLICPLLLIAAVIIFWLPTVSTPYWWDSAGYVIHSARQFVETNFSPLVPRDEYTDFAHPPFFIVILAGFWKLFGESLFVSHFLNLIFTFLALFYTYLLGKELLKEGNLGNLIGFFSAILLIFTPIFLAQLGIIYVEIPITALALMTIYYVLKKNFLGYFVSGSLMVLTKEIAGFIVLIILISTLVQKKEKFLWSLPLGVLFLWFLYHKIISGWWLVFPGRELAKGGNLWIVFKFLFLEQGRFFPTLLIIFSGVAVFFKRDLRERLLKPKIFLITLIPLATVLILGVTEFLPRYLIIALPFFYLLFFYCLALFLFKRAIREQVLILGGVTLILSLLFASSWDNHQKIESWHFPPLEENLEYLDVIEIGRETAGFIEKYHSQAVVFSAFPVNYMLAEPFQHYVSKPIKTYDCKTFKEGDRVDLIVFHLFSPGEIQCLQMIQKLGFQPLATFEKNGKRMEIYKKK